ncbi:hypothetical protein JCM8547_000822 [Rhodosporidiobolus lusitaniae]
MSWNGQQQPRRSAPLINRPSTSAAPPPQHPPHSSLGGAIAGALGGMGFGARPGGQQAYGGGAYPQQGAGGQHYPPYGQAGYGYSAPGQGGPYAQQQQQHHYNQPLHFGQPNQHLPPAPPAYPPSFYPPNHLNRQQHLPPAPYASTSATPYPSHLPQHPGTTADGYTLSSSYVCSSSSSSAPLPAFDAPSLPPASSSSRGPGKRSRGRGGGGDSQPQQQQGPKITKCCKEDCSFTGRQREVREHEEDRHLIYQPGREPKPWNGSLKPIDGAVIEGTGLSLDTPEAVARWIEERKKRWPSKKVVEEKETARAARVAAGLEAPPRERGGRGRGRGRGGAAGGRGGYGAGVREEYAPTAEREEPAVKRLKAEDGAAVGKKVGVEDEASGSSSDSDSSSSSGSSLEDEADALSQEDEEDEDDGPPEEASTKVEKGEAAEGEEEKKEPEKRFQVVCRHWRKGTCQLGDEKCPYLHHVPANAPPPPPPKRKRPAPPPPAHNPFARPSSFSSDPFALLAERDHRHMVADVLQVIEFLGANEWLRGVEMRRGQVEEESGIEVLGETKAEELGQETNGKAVVEEVEGELEQQDKPDEDDVYATSSITLAATSSIASPPSSAAPLHPTPVPSATILPSNSPIAHSLPSSLDPAKPPQPSISTPPIAANPLGLFAHYGCDSEDDEDEDEKVAASLVGGKA